MSRVWSAGGEIRWHLSGTSGATFEGNSVGTTATAFDTTIARSPGGTSIKFVGGTTATSILRSLNLTSAEVFCRAWFRVDTLPTSAAKIFGNYSTTNAAVNIWVTLTPSGTLQYWRHPTTPVQIGSDSAPISLNTWVCIQTRHYFFNTAGTDRFHCWIDGELIGEEVGGTSSIPQVPGYIYAGWITAPGTTATIWFDDIAQNITTGAYENTLPPREGRLLFMPYSRVVSNTGWHTCQSTNNTTEANLVAALNTYPPAGHADSTADTTAHQIRNITAASTGAPAYIEYECQSYGRAGVGGNVYLEPGAGTASAFGNTGARTALAQGFYLNGTVEMARIWLRKVGNPTDTINVGLVANSTDRPGATVVNYGTTSGASLTTSFVAIDVPIPDSPLTPRTKYWITLSRTGANDASNYYEVETCASGLYYDGGETLFNGTSWGAPTLTTAWHMKLYSTEGASVLSCIAIQAIHGEGVSTGTKTGVYSLVSPALDRSMVGGFGADAGAAGTFPTLWSWPNLVGSGAYTHNNILTNAAIAPRAKAGKTDSGTRAALICAMPITVEWQPVEGLWLQFTKTSDSSTWYGRHQARITSIILSDDSEILIDAGNWVMVPAQPAEDAAYPTTTVSVTDTDLRTLYTLIGPAA